MRNGWLPLWLGLWVLASSVAAAQQKEGGVALLIANANYPDAGTPLPHAIKDATSLADEFRKLNFGVELKKNLAKEEMQRTIDGFAAKIKKGTTALFYFSGFGLQVARQSYLIPINAQIWTEADVRRDGISLDALLADMHRKGANVKIVIIDAARRNPFERRIRAAAAGLAPLDTPVDSLVLYSTALGKMVNDRSSGTHSVFVAELLKELHASNLTAEEIFNRVRVDVSRGSSGEQVPWVASSLLGEYYLGGKSASVSARNTAAPPAAELDSKPAIVAVPEFPTKQETPSKREPPPPPARTEPPAKAELPPLPTRTPEPAPSVPPPSKAERMTVTVKVGEMTDNRGLLGVKVAGLNDDLAATFGLESARGAFITSVVPNGPAARAGIAPTDVVVDFDGRNITTWSDLPSVVGATPPGSSARATLWRVANSPRDLVERLQARAENGDDAAAYGLAWLYLSDHDLLRDDSVAARWSRRAAEHGHAGAAYVLGYLYSRGQGVPKDEAEAIRLFRQAADKRDANSMFALGGMYANGRGVGKDLAEARRWYQRAAEADYAPAMVAMGEIYAGGMGLPQDHNTAIKWYRTAAEKNHPAGMASLGWMYESGQGVGRDYGQASRWYHKAAEFGHAGAYYRLGAMAEAGHGSPKDPTAAANWYRKAINLDHTFAMVALGLMYENGNGVKQDGAEALRLFQNAAEKNNAAGMFYVGMHYERSKDYEKAVTHYTSAARMGDFAAMHNVAVAYDRGRGVGENRRLAAEWMFKAIKSGSAFSVKQMTDNPNAYSEPMRRYLQQMLKDAGVYSGPINGRATPAFKDAIETLAKRAKNNT
jgi:TPR repeat protein